MTVQKLKSVIEDVEQLEAETNRLQKLVDLLGEPVICPAGSGSVAPGSEGVITQYDPHRYYTEGQYEAVGVWFGGMSWDKTHWFPVNTLSLDFDEKKGVPTLMYRVVYEQQEEQITAFLDAKGLGSSAGFTEG